MKYSPYHRAAQWTQKKTHTHNRIMSGLFIKWTNLMSFELIANNKIDIELRTEKKKYQQYQVTWSVCARINSDEMRLNKLQSIVSNHFRK